MSTERAFRQSNAKNDKIWYIEKNAHVRHEGGYMDKHLIDGVGALYGALPSAAILFDSGGSILWKNKAASTRLFEFIDTPAFKKCIFTPETAQELQAFGSCYIRPGAEYGELTGVMLTSVGEGTLAVFDNSLQVRARAHSEVWFGGVDSFSGYVRGNVDRITMAAAAAESEMDSDDPAVEQLFGTVRLGSYRILRAMNNTALMGRYLSGTLTLNKTACNINELVSSLCASAAGVCRTHTRIDVRLPQEILLANVDVKLCERALLNLLSNSLRYTRENNEVEVTLSKKNGKVHLTVRDEGAGIRDENVPLVAKPYFSCEPADDGGPRPGLGLGLAVASVFCETHGGMMVINSRFGEGTAVTLTFEAGARNGGSCFRANMADYVTDKFSAVYVEFCDLCEIPK